MRYTNRHFTYLLTYEGGWAGQDAEDVGLYMRPTMPYIGRRSHARLTILRLPVTSSTAGAQLDRPV